MQEVYQLIDQLKFLDGSLEPKLDQYFQSLEFIVNNPEIEQDNYGHLVEIPAKFFTPVELAQLKTRVKNLHKNKRKDVIQELKVKIAALSENKAKDALNQINNIQ